MNTKPDKIRKCAHCGLKDRATYDTNCYTCLAEKKRDWRARNPDLVKAQRIRENAKRQRRLAELRAEALKEESP